MALTGQLEQLYATILARKKAAAEQSYVASLFAKGAEHIAKKLGEEAVETAMAAAKGDRAQVVYEGADMLFHLMVLCAQMGITPEDLEAELARREGVSGLAEKASRI